MESHIDSNIEETQDEPVGSSYSEIANFTYTQRSDLSSVLKNYQMKATDS